ncbi:MAG: ribonuclease HII [Candidatus Saccharicenans sp.]|nr:MAG: ribonuclease HII [Candidatus Aminicenantes bacterium]HEK86558.1 ribonuclease HII [Candidatus Aminicenantes bacterium]
MVGFNTEKSLIRQGYHHLAGVDEVGRGSLFGPVVAAAIVFSEGFFLKRKAGWVKEVGDSKLLRPTKRIELVPFILEAASDFGLGYATSDEIDKLNIFRATRLAMIRALKDLTLFPDIILVDGYPIKDIDYIQAGIPQGDRKVFSIAAASIVAKVFRDGLIQMLDELYPGYELRQHKGYATESHYQALEKLGPCPLHRRSFNLFKERLLVK